MNCKLIDSRNCKEYTGKLTTGITIGADMIVLLPDGKHEFIVRRIRRCMRVVNRYYIIDGNGIRFTLVLQ